ncbi:hypothetical protein OHA01_26335 [Micromonospora zamorensis]|uniref:hypothetical protein n=1 Tax=Micromonospora zamorensis TaxID=709883 RepID=UPI003868F69D|nr:hypothetical protein OHA01_26335 [Micromonospora zamorensis]
MTEQQGGQNGGQQDGSTPPEPKPFTPITSQDDLNRIIADRVSRERGKFADYGDLKAKAGRLDEIEQANKSEIERANDRVTKAEAEAAKVPSLVAGQLREHLVKLHGISTEDADLFLTASDPETLLKQVDRLVDRGSQRKKQGNHVPREGANPTSSGGDDMRSFTNELFSRALKE